MNVLIVDDDVFARQTIGAAMQEVLRREHNKRADELCNLALDGGTLADAAAAKAAPTRSPPKKPAGAVTDASVRDEAIACLDAAMKAKPTPSAALVWDQLWSILEEAGVLKKAK